jgi:hypothetical protein
MLSRVFPRNHGDDQGPQKKALRLEAGAFELKRMMHITSSAAAPRLIREPAMLSSEPFMSKALILFAIHLNRGNK